MVKDLAYEHLHIPHVEDAIRTLPHSGFTKITTEKLAYLDIDDDYIHQVFPLLQKQMDWIQKPDYFSPGSIGAHISIIYPEEQAKTMHDEDLGKKHFFNVIGTFSAELGNKKYYMLGIKSPTLLQLREKYGLPNKLWFKEHYVDLHITVATSPLFSQ